MIDLLPAWPHLSAFVLASLVLAVTPGPGVLYIVTRSVVHGRRSGLASVTGVAFGNLGNAVAASAGLGILFALSSVVFILVKYAGALYLVYLGVRLWLAADDDGVVDMPGESSRRWVRDGFVVALFNPKTTVFFAAFLPQFVTDASQPIVQTLALGGLFVAIAAVTDSLYALAAGTLASRLLKARRIRRLGRRVGGGVFVGLGALTALTGPRASR